MPALLLALALAVPCAPGQLRLAVGPEVSAATGRHPLAVRVVNDREWTCVLKGYPRVRVADTRGELPFRIVHGGDQMVTTASARRVVLRPGGAAFVVLDTYRCARGVKRSGGYLLLGSLLLRLPRARAVGWCGRGDPGSTLYVSPYEPTLRAALRGP